MRDKTDNELIAEFMGESEIINDVPFFKNRIDSNHDKIVVWEAEYNTSWDWLMPVVEKIKPLAYTVDIDSTAWRRVSGLSIFSKKDDVYRAVVEFIKWYNKP